MAGQRGARRPWRARRVVAFAGVLAMGALVVRRVHANASPSELEVGGSTGAHDIHLSCGPDVRVATASGGVRYERVFPADEAREGVGVLVDVRAGVGATTIVSVTGEGDDATKARVLDDAEHGKHHVLGAAQATVGYDWGKVALTGGIGYYGLSEVTSDQTRFRAQYWPLPALDLRVGKRTGFSVEAGFGAPPVAGLARWYSLYGVAQYRYREGGEVGVGLMTIAGELDQRSGVLVKGSIPLASGVALGGFGLLGTDDKTKALGWTAGASVTVDLDDLE